MISDIEQLFIRLLAFVNLLWRNVYAFNVADGCKNDLFLNFAEMVQAHNSRYEIPGK